MATRNLTFNRYCVTLEEIQSKTAETNASRIQSSPLTRGPLEAYAEAPIIIKDRIIGIGKKPGLQEYELGKIKELLPITHQVIEKDDLQFLATIAAIHTVRASPLHVALYRAQMPYKSALSLNSFNEWAHKHMHPGAWNVLLRSDDYSELREDQLAADLHIAATAIASKSIALAILGYKENEIEEILMQNSERMRSYKKSEKTGPELTKIYLALLRISATDTKRALKIDGMHTSELVN